MEKLLCLEVVRDEVGLVRKLFLCAVNGRDRAEARYRRKLVLVLFVAAMAVAHAASPVMEAYNRAWIMMGQLRYDDEVVATLEGMIGTDKTFHRAYRLLAEVYVKRKEAEAGERYFRELAARDSANELAHYGLGDVLRLRGDVEGASGEYRICTSMNPRSYVCQERVKAFGFRGLADTQLNKAQSEHFGKLLERDPSNPVLYLEVALVFGSLNQYGKMGEPLEKALTTARKTGDHELEQVLLDELAGLAWRTGGGGWEPLLNRAIEQLARFQELGDLERQFECRQDLSNLKMTMGQLEEAMARAKQILSDAVEIGNLLQQARAHDQITEVYSRNGQIDEAIEHRRISNELFSKMGITLWSNRLAGLHARRGEYPVAIELMNEDLEHQRKTGDIWNVAQSLRNLGVFHLELGDYAKALDYGTQAVKVFQKLGHDHPAKATIGNLGNVYAALGDYSRALSCVEQSLKNARERQDASEIQRNLGNVAEIYHEMGDHARAFKVWGEALAMSGKIRMPSFDAGVYLSRSSAYDQMGKPELALRDAEVGLRMERQLQLQPDLGYALNRVGFLNLKLGHVDTAAPSFEEALHLSERAGLREVAWDAQHGLGQVAESQSHLTEALEHYRAAIAAIEVIRGQNLPAELKGNFFQDRIAPYQSAVALLDRLNTGNGKQGYAVEAFRIAEQSRARAFVDSLTESKIEVRKGISPEQRARELQLKYEISRASKKLLATDTPATRADLKRSEEALSDFAIELRSSDPRYQELRYPEPYTVEKAQRELLSDGEALVEYFAGETDLFAWVLTRSSTGMVKLGDWRRIEREIREYRKILSVRPSEAAALTQFRAQSQRLYAFLVSPLLPQAKGVRKLLIVPDGILYYLPFETLLSRRGRFLVEDYTMSYAPSALAAANLRRDLRPGDEGRLELLAFGDPRFRGRSSAREILDDNPQAVVRSALEAEGRKFTPLPMTREEVNGIARLFPARSSVVRVGTQASESAFKREHLSRYKRIHLATHAVLDEGNPQRSGIVLTLPGDGGEDGILQPREIMDLDIRADLVVLSACETALGKIVRGEGMVGLTRAFFYAGAPRVVVSLWKVNDAATADLMQAFYRSLRHKDDVASALRSAKVNMIHSEVAFYRHPYYWAPFILAGSN